MDSFLIPPEIVGGEISGLGSLIFFSTGFKVEYTNLLAKLILVYFPVNRENYLRIYGHGRSIL